MAYLELYLEDRETRLRESIKMRSRAGSVGKFSSENLHPQKGKYKDEEKENNEEGINGRYGVDQRLDQVTH